ncbi:MAG: hypothetical protein ACRD3W_18255, partial [Terriglobales bacterium]
NISEIECRMPKVTCHCRYSQFKQAVQRLPGIITVMLGPGVSPTILVLFDSRQASKSSIIDSKGVTALHQELESSNEKRIVSIAELGDLAAKFVTPLHAPVFGFEDVALQFPSPIAESGNTAISIGDSKTN